MDVLKKLLNGAVIEEHKESCNELDWLWNFYLYYLFYCARK